MRFIKTFVLHLYIDLEAADQLCGDLKALPDRKVISFRNPAEMIALLQRFISQVPEKPTQYNKPKGDSHHDPIA